MAPCSAVSVTVAPFASTFVIAPIGVPALSTGTSGTTEELPPDAAAAGAAGDASPIASNEDAVSAAAAATAAMRCPPLTVRADLPRDTKLDTEISFFDEDD